jgi:hypothetical protein
VRGVMNQLDYVLDLLDMQTFNRQSQSNDRLDSVPLPVRYGFVLVRAKCVALQVGVWTDIGNEMNSYFPLVPPH